MPDIGFYHPLVIHFVIALLMVGVAFRWGSFTTFIPFASGAAVALIVLGTLAAVVAVRSGEDASVFAEALPGTASAVASHARRATVARNVFLVVAGLEVAALLSSPSRARLCRAGSAWIGVIGLVCLVNAGRLGGELVYAHAAGIGVRSGDPRDVTRLLLAGLYEQSDIDRRSDRPADAAALMELAATRFPNDPAVQVLAAKSLLEDRHDPGAALAMLERIRIEHDDRALRLRRGTITADAFAALGDTKQLRVTLETLRREFPENDRVRRRLAGLEHSSG